jgi:hypothetical protein
MIMSEHNASSHQGSHARATPHPSDVWADGAAYEAYIGR